MWIATPALRTVPFETYCRQANAFVEAAAYYGWKSALYNHLGIRVESPQDLDDFMAALPGATLLLDTAYIHAAGGDCVETIRKYHICSIAEWFHIVIQRKSPAESDFEAD